MGDSFSLKKDDLKGRSRKTAPGGTYQCIIRKDSKIKPGRKGGNVLEVKGEITKGAHKGTLFFDSIAPHVSWKVGQLVFALNLKMMKGTIQALLKKIAGKELRVILREEEFQGQRRNKVVQWLPLKGAPDAEEDDEEDEDEEDEDEDDEDEDEEDEDEDDEDEEDEDEDEDDEDEEDEDEDDEDEEEPPAKKSKKPAPAKKRSRK